MSVRTICGLPGGGKSTYAVMMLVRELKDTDRAIVTNLPLDLGRLNEYMQEKYPQKDHAVVQRVRILPIEDLRAFWCFRGRDAQGNWITLQPPIKPEAETDFRPLTEKVAEAKAASQPHDANNRTACQTGVAYFLDEIHTVFNARRWMDTGPGALWYLSQHRKLGDDIWFITQRPQQVDKQLKMLSEEYVKLTNLRKRKFLQIFRMPRKFVHHHYYEEPDKLSKPEVTGMFSLDVTGIGSLYDTSAGNGIAGQGGADKGEKVRGVPWYALAILPLLIPVAFKGADMLAAAGLRKVSNLGMAAVPGSQALTNRVKAAGVPAGPIEAPAAMPAPPVRNALDVQEVPLPVQAPVVGWVKMGGTVRVYREDGSYDTPQTGVTQLEQTYVVVNGRREAIGTPEKRPAWSGGHEAQLAWNGDQARGSAAKRRDSR